MMRRYGLWQSNDIWLDSLTSGFVLLHLLINAATARERWKRKKIANQMVCSQAKIFCALGNVILRVMNVTVSARASVCDCALHVRNRMEFPLSFSRLPNVGAVRSMCMFAHLSFYSEWYYKKYGRQVVPYKWNLHLLQGPRVAWAALLDSLHGGEGETLHTHARVPFNLAEKNGILMGETEGGAHSNDFKRLLLCAECV